MVHKNDLQQRFITAIQRQQWLSRGNPIIVAVSGGADSVALLHLLLAFNQQTGWNLRFHIAHLNHGLRGADSDADAAFVQNLAHTLALSASIEPADVATAAAQRKLSIEAAGRQCRLEFLERTAIAQNAHTVALGHHADDQAETVLHRIIRGTSLRGLGGMAAKRAIRPGSPIQLIRPLLHFERTEIEQYVTQNALAFRTDATNQSRDYTRNRIRHLLLPIMREQFNPNVDGAIRRLAAEAQSAHTFLNRASIRAFSRLAIVEKNQIRIHQAAFQQLSPPLQTRIILRAVSALGIGEGRLDHRHLHSIARWMAGPSTEPLLLPADLWVSREHDQLLLQRGRPAESVPLPEMPISIPGTAHLVGTPWRITIESPLQADATGQPPNQPPFANESIREEWLDADQIEPPLILRTRRQGDRFHPLGSTGSRLLSDFFVDAKISRQERNRTPILCDARGPIWVIPWRIEHRTRITPPTRRILRIRAEQA